MVFQSLWAGPYLMAILGMNRISAGYLIMLLSVSQLLSLPFGGILSDKIFHSRKVPLLIASFGAVLFWLPFNFYTGDLLPWHIALLFIYSGLLAGISSGPVFTLLKELHPRPLTGTAIGVGNFFNMAGAALGRGLKHQLQVVSMELEQVNQLIIHLNEYAERLAEGVA